VLKVLGQLVERLSDCFHLYVLERIFQSMEPPEAKAMRFMIEDIETLKEAGKSLEEKK